MTRLRRKIIVSTLAFFAGVVPAMAGEIAVIPQDGNPYFTVTPIVAEDKATVREFFQFTCPFCRDMHPTIWNWGSSLPRKLIFEPTPIISDEASIMAAMGFYAVYTTAPDKLSMYCKTVFKQVQANPALLGEIRMHVDAARSVGVPINAYLTAMRSKKVEGLVHRASVMATRYKIVNTPTISVAGRYTINPEIVDGDLGKFISLANAVASKQLLEM